MKCWQMQLQSYSGDWTKQWHLDDCITGGITASDSVYDAQYVCIDFF